MTGGQGRVSRRSALALGAAVLAGMAMTPAAHADDAAKATGDATMDNANIKVVQDAYAAFGKGDVPAVLALLTTDVVWESVGRPQDFPVLGPRQGIPAVADWFKQVGTLLTFQSLKFNNFYAVDNMVFVLGHYDRTVVKTDKPANSDFVHAFTITGGKIASYREFADTATLADAWRGE